MPIQVACPECGKKYRLPDERAGGTLDCKECGTEIDIPGGNRRRAIDNEPPRRVIKAENIELRAGCRVKHIRERDLYRLREGIHPRRLNRDVEGVLQHPRRQHVLDQFWRHRVDADLHVVERLAVEVQALPGATVSVS